MRHLHLSELRLSRRLIRLEFRGILPARTIKNASDGSTSWCGIRGITRGGDFARAILCRLSVRALTLLSPIALTGCGSDGSGNLVSTPVGPSSPAYATLASGTGTLSAKGVGEYYVSLSGTTAGSTTIKDQTVEITFDAITQTYTLRGALDPASSTLTSVAYDPTQTLHNKGLTTYAAGKDIAGNSVSSFFAPGSALTYSSWGYWQTGLARPNGDSVNDNIYFTYGIRTDPADMPKTGTATYGLTINGHAQLGFGGSGSLTAAFASGRVSVTLSPYESGGGAQFNPLQTPFATLTGTGTIDAATSSFQSSIAGTASTGEKYAANLTGLFYGPQAAEVGATFQMFFGSNAQPFAYGVVTGQKN